MIIIVIHYVYVYVYVYDNMHTYVCIYIYIYIYVQLRDMCVWAAIIQLPHAEQTYSCNTCKDKHQQNTTCSGQPD